MARKKKVAIVLPPRDLAEYYGRGIKQKIFPNEDNQTDGYFVFEDDSTIQFRKSNRYYPTTENTEDSFALKLTSDLIGFKYDTGNTNEVGFEMQLRDGSVLRRVPLGKPAQIAQTLEEIVEDLKKETTSTSFEELLDQADPRIKALLNAKVVNKQKRDSDQ